MRKRFLILISLLTLALLFAGCGTEVDAAVTPEPSPVPTPAPTPAPTPEPFAEGFDLCGRHYEKDAAEIDLSGYGEADLEMLLAVKPYLTSLERIELGSEEISPVPWEEIYELEQAFPGIEIGYTFDMYGKTFHLSDSKMDLNHREVDDQGEYIREVIRCMPNLTFLDLDSCEIDSEHCAAIRDDFPGIEVVWRIWFGHRYTVRTDVERILASKPSAYGDLKSSNMHDLMYCTKVKYLDLGHNDTLDRIDFCAYMPDLEVAIIAMTFRVSDLTPLTNCTKLEFLELQSNEITDLRPLSGLYDLEYLNLVQNFELNDITPLFGLKKLKKLYLGCTDPVPKMQVEAFRSLMPNCAINTISFDPHEGDWRYDFSRESHTSERYDLLKEQFGYNGEASPYSVAENDPLFYPHDDED